MMGSREDITHNSIYVRLLRQYVPSNDWNRLPLESECPGDLFGEDFGLMVPIDDVSRGSDRTITIVGYCGTREVPQSHTFIHPGFKCGSRGIRHLK